MPSQVYEKFEKIKKLGRGATGTSYLVKIIKPPPDFTPELLAVVKYIDVGKLSQKGLEDTMSLAKDMEKFEHPNLLKVREAGLTQTGKLTIVTEFGEGGNLYYDLIA